MIKKSGNKFKVMDSEGKKTLGSHSTRKEALAQLRAIEASKAKGYADGGAYNDAESLSPILKDSYSDKKKARKDALKRYADGGAKRLDKDSMPCNKPRRSPKSDKSKVVKGCEGGKEKIVHFGDPNMRIKKSNPKRKKSYCARSSGIKGKNSKLSANHWSRKEWDC